MKHIIRLYLFVVLCTILCSSSIIVALAEEPQSSLSADSFSEEFIVSDGQSQDSRYLSSPIQICFTTDEKYDLTGLVVIDALGNEIQPTRTGSEWVYLLTSGKYTYSYHDERDIFFDIQEQQFVVEDEGLTFRLTLTPIFAENYAIETFINPLYIDVVEESDLIQPSITYAEEIDRILSSLGVEDESGESSFLEESPTFYASSGNVSDATVALRKKMADRTQTVTISFFTDSSMTSDLASAMSEYFVPSAFAHTGNHSEGDTLRFEFMGYYVSYTWNISVSGGYRHDYTYTLTYYTNYSQEMATRNEVSRILNQLSLEGKTDYQKVFLIHQYLYQQVNYDYPHLNDTSYVLQYTGYAALIQKIAVCQGFSVAFYRLCLASGVDARVVQSDNINHAWNIVRLDGMYYEIDSTWDSNIREDGDTYGVLPFNFLRGSNWWSQYHNYKGVYSGIGDQFYSSSIHYDSSFNEYVLSTTDYSPGIAINSANFPDNYFRQYISNSFDKDVDGYLSIPEIINVTSINISGTIENAGLVTTLKGIELFPFLEELDCAYNQISSLDVSHNSALRVINCMYNRLTFLNIGINSALQGLNCSFNQLTNLDVSGYKALQVLYCGFNKLTALNINGLSNLTSLECSMNQLTSIDISSSKSLISLSCVNNNLANLDLSNNTALSTLNCPGNKLSTLNISRCIAMRSLVQNQTPTISSSGEYITYDNDDAFFSCDVNVVIIQVALDQEAFSDQSFRNYIAQRIDIDKDGFLSVPEISATIIIDCSGTEENSGEITSLKGIEYFTALQGLWCSYNHIAELDLTQNTNLIVISCSNNQLSELDLTNNSKLRMLVCNNNKLTTLSLSNNDALSSLWCDNNSIKVLNLSGKSNLEIISCGHNQLTSLNLSENTALRQLECDNNQLSSLDISSNNAVQYLSCNNNLLTSILFGNNAELKSIYCSHNHLSSLNLNGLSAVEYFGCSDNRLTEINLSGFEHLIGIECNSNLITNLSVTNNTELRFLNCADNMLSELDVSCNPMLEVLICCVNYLPRLDIRNCPVLNKLTENESSTSDGIISYQGDAEYLQLLEFNDSVTLVLDPEHQPIDFILPASLATVDDEAFSGGAFVYVKLPENAVSVGWHAFADCPNLTYIYIPALTTQIDEQAFGNTTDLTIIGVPGTYASTYADEHGFTFVPAA